MLEAKNPIKWRHIGWTGWVSNYTHVYWLKTGIQQYTKECALSCNRNLKKPNYIFVNLNIRFKYHGNRVSLPTTDSSASKSNRETFASVAQFFDTQFFDCCWTTADLVGWPDFVHRRFLTITKSTNLFKNLLYVINTPTAVHFFN